MTNEVWKTGAIGDITFPGDWVGNAAPQSGDTGTIGAGQAQISPTDSLPSPLTLDVGTLQGSLTAVPTSIVVDEGAPLPSGLTIDDTASGGTIASGVYGPVVGAALVVIGPVTSDATINIGPGDILDIVPFTGSSNSFINDAPISLNGVAGNDAALYIGPAPNSSASLTATYGSISANYGLITAAAPDSGLGIITLSNDSGLLATANISRTHIFFADGTDTLALGQVSGANSFEPVGQITGFQQGDTIALLSGGGAPAAPASVTYSGGVLTVSDASSNVLEQLNIGTSYTNAGFYLSQQPSVTVPTGTASFTSQDDIALGDLWVGGDSSSTLGFDKSSNWSNGVPTSGETAIIGANSKAAVNSTNTIPSSLTLDMGSAVSSGTEISNWSASATSNLAITDESLASGDTINVTAAGGALSFGAANTAMVAGMGVNGAVTDAGTINVGAGDALTIGIAADSPTATNGAFDNTGVINLVGSSNSPAFMRVKLGNQGTGSTTDAYAGYGNVNLSQAIFFAEAPDQNALGASFAPGVFNLSNYSTLAVLAGAVFNNTSVVFRDGTGGLVLGENASGNFYDYGNVYGFQAGDTIQLAAVSGNPIADTPASLSYDQQSGVLSIDNSSNAVIGQVTLVGNYSASDFVLSGATATNVTVPGYTYSNIYTISFNPSIQSATWQSGVTGDFYNSSNWVGGVVPSPGDTATLQQGTIQLGPSEGIDTPLTLDVGATAASTFSAPTSTVQVVYDNLSSGLTIDNTLSGGSIVSPGQNGPVVLSAIDAAGTVVSGATIDIGAGDMEDIGVSAFSSASTPGVFDNFGQINVDGSTGNFGVLYVGAGGPNNGAGATVDYGTVVADGGAIFAAVADAPANSLAASFIPGNFYLSNGSVATAFAPLQNTNVIFLDGTDKLALTPQSTGATYQFGGEIYGMQVGDAIAFEENATSPQPASISVSNGTDANGNATTILTVSDSGGNPLGSVTIEGSYQFGDFTGVQNATTPLAPFGYTGAYDVTLTTNPANIWTGATADFNTPSAWTLGVPAAGGAATVASGTVQVSAADGALSGVTFNVGAISLGVNGVPTPAANIAITDTTLAANIANTAGGGELFSSASPLDNQYNTPSILHLAGVQANGTVNYTGQLTVGAGDAVILNIAPDSATTSAWGDFNNQDQIDLTGAGNNTAAMLVMQNVNSASAGGYAQYGTVNLSDGQFFAEAPDSTLGNPPSASTGTFSLSNDSQLSVANTILNDTNVVFQDGTDTLQIGEDASGQYMFGSANGMISGFQAGDTIDLLESDSAGTPTSISYDTTTGTLDIYNASMTQIGTLHIADTGNFSPTSFVGMPGQGGNTPPGANYQGEYVIKLGQDVASLDVTGSQTVSQSDTLIVDAAATVETGATLSVDGPSTGAGGSELAVGGALTVNSGGTLQVGNVGISAAATVTAQSLSNAGTIDIAGGGADASASLTITSPTPNVLSGNVDISGNGQLVFQGGQVNELAGNLTLNGAEAFVTDQYDLLNNNDLVYLNRIDQNASLTLDNGAAVFVANSLTDSGAISIDASVGGGSNLTLGGQLQIENTGSLGIGAAGAGLADKASLDSLRNSGTISLKDSFAELSITGAASNFSVIEGLGHFDADPQSSVTLINNNGATIDANAGGVLSLDNWSSISNSGALEADGGTLQVNAGVSGSGSGVIKGDGTLQLNAAFSQGVDFQGLGTLDLTGEGSNATTVFTENFSGAISGFTGTGAANSDVIDVVGSGGTDHVVWAQNSGSGTLQVEDSSNNVLETLTLNGTYFQNQFVLTDPASVDQITYNSSAACYALGTAIATEDGEIAAEDLRIGDLVRTASGVLRPIVWIGRRSYSARFARNNPDLPPICFKAGSLADSVPARDLRVSPKHAMFLDGVLVPAEHLVNGATVVQDEPGEDIHYFHIELASHDVLIAEGAFSESFVDDDSRDMFHNAREFDALYPDRRGKEAVYCAPRVEDGFGLDRIRRRLAERAGLALPAVADFGALRGAVEHCDLESVAGWARNAAFPDAPVCLDVMVDGAPAGYAYAADERPDGGWTFSLRFAEALDPAREHEIELRRSADGALLDSRLIPAVAAA